MSAHFSIDCTCAVSNILDPRKYETCRIHARRVLPLRNCNTMHSPSLCLASRTYCPYQACIGRVCPRCTGKSHTEFQRHQTAWPMKQIGTHSRRQASWEKIIRETCSGSSVVRIITILQYLHFPGMLSALACVCTSFSRVCSNLLNGVLKGSSLC